MLAAAVLGSVLNDSGLNVAAAVLAVAWPAAVAVGATPTRSPTRVPSDDGQAVRT